MVNKGGAKKNQQPEDEKPAPQNAAPDDGMPEEPLRDPTWFGEPPSAIEDEVAEIRDFERQQRGQAARFGGLNPFTNDKTPEGGWRQVRLATPGTCTPAAAALGATEAELTGLIAELRVLLREVAGQSARLSVTAGERVQFLDAACRLAKTGAELAGSVASLRGQGTGETIHKRVTMDFVHHRPAEAGDTPLP